MTFFSRILVIVLAVSVMPVTAQDAREYVDHDEMLMDHGGGHMMDFGGGMVMGQNADLLPQSCESIEDDIEITVHAGRKYAEKFPGRMFAFDKQEWKVRPCTRITWHFINEDNVRHQFMMHGLPKYIYKSGMFHLEVTGPGKISGTMIVPVNDQTYLVHCDISQHMEKGMKGQLVVGKGGTSLPSIPGLTPFAFPDSYELGETSAAPVAAGQSPTPLVPPAGTTVVSGESSGSLFVGLLVMGLAFGLLAAPMLTRKFEGMNRNQVLCYLANQASLTLKSIVSALVWLVQFITVQVKKVASRS